ALVDRDTGEAYIHNIAVAASHQGQGLATRLLRHGLAWMFTFPEVKRIELSVREENVAAMRVYEKAGFRKIRAVRQMRKRIGTREG
ncbi:MAG: GNAT family N-acetyltransferase, partial [Actinomycetota bacterium]|nr:GNAT family N-acetyltransferase [Actinomycetota bacterium]